MHLYTAIVICIVFVCLMSVVIVNETISVIEVLSTLVSSVEILSLSGPHRYSMIGLSGMYQNESSFNVSDICDCKVETSRDSTNCSLLTLLHQPQGEQVADDPSLHRILLLTAGPRDWQQRESVVFECLHSFVPLITYFVMPQDYQAIQDTVQSNNENVSDHLDESIFNSPSPWINSNTINQVLLSREDHYNKHELEKSYIKTIVSQASHDQEGFTQITFSWREGQVTKIDKFHNGSYWSLATLMCTVLLGVERCVAFVNRAKNQRRQTAPTQVKVAEANMTPSPTPDASFIKGRGGDDARLVWSGEIKKSLK
ncbi:uncharacterized protein LOC134840107 [Symsagittifera roscoffensis]|uniref:uncharacterized protein LOC134840107 n=1 Tax=Symsagittifera roscoffensis TaxID=84072 RepID=UPI00307C387C